MKIDSIDRTWSRLDKRDTPPRWFELLRNKPTGVALAPFYCLPSICETGALTLVVVVAPCIPSAFSVAATVPGVSAVDRTVVHERGNGGGRLSVDSAATDWKSSLGRHRHRSSSNHCDRTYLFWRHTCRSNPKAQSTDRNSFFANERFGAPGFVCRPG